MGELVFQVKKTSNSGPIGKRECTLRFFTVVYTFSIPWVNMKYSEARSYACQGGSMLRNLSPETAGTISHKAVILAPKKR